MKQRDVGFTQGVGWAIMYTHRFSSRDCAMQLAEESGILLSDFEKVCDEFDLEFIRKALRK